MRVRDDRPTSLFFAALGVADGQLGPVVGDVSARRDDIVAAVDLLATGL